MVTLAAVGARAELVKNPPLTTKGEFVPVVPAIDCPIEPVIEKCIAARRDCCSHLRRMRRLIAPVYSRRPSPLVL
jgi:hypothetical protein